MTGPSRRRGIHHTSGFQSYIHYDRDMQQGKVDRALLTRVARYGRPYLKLHALALTTVVGLALLTVVPPLLIRDVIDVAIPSGDLDRVTVLGLLMVAVPLLTGLLEVAQRWASAMVGESVVFDLRKELVEHLRTMHFGFYVGSRTGELMARLTTDVIGAQQALAGSIVTLATSALTVAVTLATMVVIDWRLSLLSMAVLPFFYVVGRALAGRLRAVTREQMDSWAGLSGIVDSALNVSGALLVKVFGRADLEDERFQASAAEVGRLGVRRVVLNAWLVMAFNLAGVVGLAGVFGIGALLVIDGGIDVGDVVALSLLLGNLYRPLGTLANAPVEIATSVVSFERVFEVLDMPPAITERPAAIDLDPIEGRVEFRNVGFRYDDGAGLAPARRYTWTLSTHSGLEAPPPPAASDAAPTLAGVSFAVAPGAVVALVGPSGAGKTTIGYLVRRIFDVTEGAVLVDGVDVRDLTLGSLERGIGVVTQEPLLLHDTVAANLRCARPGAGADELEAACRTAQIHDAVAALPHGYDTVVGERGYRLSGGERQRLAIARVVLADPRIVILDEATAHLDAASEALVHAALESLWAGRTSLVIAHRLATIVAADEILVLDGGRIVERGTHDELVSAGGRYARLYAAQSTATAASRISER